MMLLRYNLTSIGKALKISSNMSAIVVSSMNFHSGQPVQQGHKFQKRNYEKMLNDHWEQMKKEQLAEQEAYANGTKKISIFTAKGVKHYFGKAKELWGKYGLVATVTYATCYLSMFGTYFLLLDNGIISTSMVGIDQAAAVEKLGTIFTNITENASIPKYIQDNPQVTNAAVAIAMSELSEPIRLAILYFSVPTIAKWVGKVPKDEITPTSTSTPKI